MPEPKIVVYSSRPSRGTALLTETLRSLGCRTYRLRRPARVIRDRDLIVNWGEEYPLDCAEPPGRVLNPIHVTSKLEELHLLQDADIPCPVWSLFNEGPGWLPRSAHHKEADDLLIPPEQPDFWVKKLDIIREFRIHIFQGHSIRAGMKKPRPGCEPHEWIRSYQSGWTIYYDEEAHRRMRQRFRDMARRAVAALGYDFGAVDLGILRGGEMVVLEVNSAPGLEGNTALAYAEKIKGVFEQ